MDIYTFISLTILYLVYYKTTGEICTRVFKNYPNFLELVHSSHKVCFYLVLVPKQRNLHSFDCCLQCTFVNISEWYVDSLAKLIT